MRQLIDKTSELTYNSLMLPGELRRLIDKVRKVIDKMRRLIDKVREVIDKMRELIDKMRKPIDKAPGFIDKLRMLIYKIRSLVSHSANNVVVDIYDINCKISSPLFLWFDKIYSLG